MGTLYVRYTAPRAADARQSGDLTLEELSQIGFFRRFEHDANGQEYYRSMYAPIDAGGQSLRGDVATVAQASARAAEDETRWDQLASGIPALSFAAARNPIRLLGQQGPGRNIDMQALRDPDNGWPASRAELWGTRWLHSDVRNVAMPYVYEAYERILRLGGFGP